VLVLLCVGLCTLLGQETGETERETGETQTARRYTYENIPQNMRISNTYTRVNGLIKQHHKMQYITYIYSIDVGITMISIR